jgi:hypothetical protein
MREPTHSDVHVALFFRHVHEHLCRHYFLHICFLGYAAAAIFLR